MSNIDKYLTYPLLFHCVIYTAGMQIFHYSVMLHHKVDDIQFIASILRQIYHLPFLIVLIPLII